MICCTQLGKRSTKFWNEKKIISQKFSRPLKRCDALRAKRLVGFCATHLPGSQRVIGFGWGDCETKGAGDPTNFKIDRSDHFFAVRGVGGWPVFLEVGATDHDDRWEGACQPSKRGRYKILMNGGVLLPNTSMNKECYRPRDRWGIWSGQAFCQIVGRNDAPKSTVKSGSGSSDWTLSLRSV